MLQEPAGVPRGPAGTGIREIRMDMAEAGARPLLVPTGPETPHDLVTGVRL